MLDRNSPKPLYLQLEDILRKEITSGAWKPDSLIPSENELGKLYGLSRMTVRSVITTLVKEGLLYRVQGKGTFVAKDKISAAPPIYHGVREQLEMQGYQIKTDIVDFSYILPDQKTAEALDIADNVKVLFIRRVRSADGVPISLHSSYIPEDLCPDMHRERIEEEQLCNVLKDDYNLEGVHVSETLESVLANREEAQLLGIEKGYPLLLLQERLQTNALKLG